MCKQVEGLQLNRLNEVEELAYLRWVNSCLRNELRNSCSTMNVNKLSSPSSVESGGGDSFGSLSSQSNEYLEYSSAKRLNLLVLVFCCNRERRENVREKKKKKGREREWREKERGGVKIKKRIFFL